MTAPPSVGVGAASGTVLFTLSSGQFLMALDSSVMNVSIATVASDLGTTVTGIQTAITLYTLVMASLMITGGKIGQIIGRKRAFALGCVIYGVRVPGHGTGAQPRRAPGRLVAARRGRCRTDHAGDRGTGGLQLRSGRAGPCLRRRRRVRGHRRGCGPSRRRGGDHLRVLEVGVRGRGGRSSLGILLLARRTADAPAEPGVRLDLVGTGLSALGLGTVVYGILRAGSWGAVLPKPGAPSIAGLSPVVWLILGGGLVLVGFAAWERRRLEEGAAALMDPAMLGTGSFAAD